MEVDINDVLGAQHEIYLRIIRELTHEVAVLRAKVSVLQKKEQPDA